MFIKVSINLIARKELTLLNIYLWVSFIIFTLESQHDIMGEYWLWNQKSQVQIQDPQFYLLY